MTSTQARTHSEHVIGKSTVSSLVKGKKVFRTYIEELQIVMKAAASQHMHKFDEGDMHFTYTVFFGKLVAICCTVYNGTFKMSP